MHARPLHISLKVAYVINFVKKSRMGDDSRVDSFIILVVQLFITVT